MEYEWIYIYMLRKIKKIKVPPDLGKGMKNIQFQTSQGMNGKKLEYLGENLLDTNRTLVIMLESKNRPL